MGEFWKKISKSDIRNVLAVIATVGCFILMYLMQVKAIPVENKDVVNIAVGFLFGGALSSVFGFYFGASKTEDKKESE